MADAVESDVGVARQMAEEGRCHASPKDQAEKRFVPQTAEARRDMVKVQASRLCSFKLQPCTPVKSVQCKSVAYMSKRRCLHSCDGGSLQLQQSGGRNELCRLPIDLQNCCCTI